MRRTALLLPLLPLLAGCGVTSAVEELASSVADSVSAPAAAAGARSGTADSESSVDTIAFAAAYCQNDAETALSTTRELLSSHPDDPRIRLIHGMALDLSGRGVAAYRQLEPLAAGDDRTPAVLKCGNKFVYSGTVSEVAERRLFEVRTRLSALGVTFPLTPAARAREAAKAVYAFAAMAPTSVDVGPAPMKVATHAAVQPPAADASDAGNGAVPKPRRKPQAASASGRYFAHLGSYRTMKTLDAGWHILKQRYRKLLSARHKAVARVDLGPKKGKFLRLGVAMPDRGSATKLCRHLKSQGQYCAVMASGKG